MNYVGFWRRFAAALLDGLILGAVNFLLGFIFGSQGVSYSTSGYSSTSPLQSILSLAVWIGYVVFYQAQTGQTLGKKVMGIKVVTLDGKRPSALTFFLRDVIGKIVSSVILFIGYLWVIWDSKKQALHDKIASTYVVKA